MAEITTDDLLKKLDEKSIRVTRLELQKEALIREVETLKKLVPPPPAPPKPNRAQRRKAKKEN